MFAVLHVDEYARLQAMLDSGRNEEVRPTGPFVTEGHVRLYQSAANRGSPYDRLSLHVHSMYYST